LGVRINNEAFQKTNISFNGLNISDSVAAANFNRTLPSFLLITAANIASRVGAIPSIVFDEWLTNFGTRI
jgi:hypothetical protein